MWSPSTIYLQFRQNIMEQLFSYPFIWRNSKWLIGVREMKLLTLRITKCVYWAAILHILPWYGQKLRMKQQKHMMCSAFVTEIIIYFSKLLMSHKIYFNHNFVDVFYLAYMCNPQYFFVYRILLIVLELM